MEFGKNNMLTEIEVVQDRINEIMKEFFGDAYSRGSLAYLSWTPAMDVYETEEDIIILMELAGVRKEDLRVILDRNTVCIAGKREACRGEHKLRCHQMEISFGPFKRILRVSVPVNGDAVEASFQDGLLTIRLRKQVPVSVKINIVT